MQICSHMPYLYHFKTSPFCQYSAKTLWGFVCGLKYEDMYLMFLIANSLRLREDFKYLPYKITMFNFPINFYKWDHLLTYQGLGICCSRKFFSSQNYEHSWLILAPHRISFNKLYSMSNHTRPMLNGLKGVT